MRRLCMLKVGNNSRLFAHIVNADKSQLFTVLAELRNELVPINRWCVLRDGRSNKKDPSKLDNTREGVKHREAEQQRRAAIRSLQDQISVFFLVQGQKKISVGELLLFGKSNSPRSESTVYLPNCSSYHLSEGRRSCLPRSHPPPLSWL